MHMYEDAYVYDSVGKKIGKVSRIINSEYIVVRKKGLITDEEFQIPVGCVSHFNSSEDHLSITLTIDQSCLKHGFEVISGGSGGAIPSDHEPELIPTSKETIRYTVDETQHGNNQSSLNDSSFTNSSSYFVDRLPQDSSFICDMCSKRLDNQEKLQAHRVSEHNTATDV
ncbi:MAG: hypothetical protein ACRD8Z_06670 [Nitrososphaeraceae archaeon]